MKSMTTGIPAARNLAPMRIKTTSPMHSNTAFDIVSIGEVRDGGMRTCDSRVKTSWQFAVDQRHVLRKSDFVSF